MNRFSSVWGTLSAGQRALVLVVALGAAAAFAAVSMLAQPDYAPLYGRLTVDEAAQVVDKLRAMNAPYKLAGATTILVPRDKVYNIRLQMAGEGIPRGSGAGFELFDKTTMGTTEMAQRVNFQRALQGELARSIESLEEVESARIHLALPQERLFENAGPEPSASVVVRLKGAASLSRKQVRAIANLVASGVERLSPERVTVVDTAGVLLSGGGPDSGGAGTAQNHEREQVEVAIESRLQTMLDRVLGPGKSIVRVSAEIDFAKRHVEEESLVRDGRAPRSEVAIEETYQGRGAPPAGGPAGQTASPPSYAASAAGGANSQYSRKETRTNYEVARRVEKLVTSGGGLRRLSVAVLVDAAVPAAQIAAIREAVQAGVGFDPQRRDNVVVQSVPFPAPAGAGAEAPPAAPRAALPIAPLAIGGGALLLMLAAVVVLAVRGGRRGRTRVETLQPAAITSGAGPGRAAALAASADGDRDGARAARDDEEERVLRALRSKGGEPVESSVVRREAQRIASERPEDVAAVVKNWISAR